MNREAEDPVAAHTEPAAVPDPALPDLAAVSVSRSALGRLMMVIAVFGVIVGSAVAIVGATLVSSLRTTVDDSLELTGDTLDTAADSIALSSSIVATLRLSLDSVSAALTAVQTSVDDTADSLEEIGAFASGPLATTIQSIADVLPTIETTASAVDDALRLLSSAPFGPDYDPDQPFDESIAGLSDALSPLPDELRSLDDDVTSVTTSAADVSEQLTLVIDDVAALTERLDGIDLLLERYASTAERAQVVAADSRTELDRGAQWGIALAVLVGLLVIVSQLVPFWLGRRLAARPGRGDDLDPLIATP